MNRGYAFTDAQLAESNRANTEFTTCPICLSPAGNPLDATSWHKEPLPTPKSPYFDVEIVHVKNGDVWSTTQMATYIKNP